jgi:hypothetical protein
MSTNAPIQVCICIHINAYVFIQIEWIRKVVDDEQVKPLEVHMYVKACIYQTDIYLYFSVYVYVYRRLYVDIIYI